MSQTLPITKLTVGCVSPTVLVCGDAARAEQIAAALTGASLLSQNREYHVYQGTYRERPLTVCSHGVGAPGAAIAFEELIAAGARHIIRVGTCGGLAPAMQSGHLVVATAAVDNTGYGPQTVPFGYPAVADPAVALTLRETAVATDHDTHTGLVLTCDNFYAGVTMPQTPNYETMAAANVLAVEMECAALFVLGSLRGIATGAILAVDGNVLAQGETMEAYAPHRDIVKTAVAAAIDIALETAVQLPIKSS